MSSLNKINKSEENITCLTGFQVRIENIGLYTFSTVSTEKTNIIAIDEPKQGFFNLKNTRPFQNKVSRFQYSTPFKCVTITEDVVKFDINSSSSPHKEKKALIKLSSSALEKFLEEEKENGSIF